MPKKVSSSLAKVASSDETVCVVMPFYNARTTLRQAVFSVLKQSYSAWRLILLDDGSVDDSIDTISDLIDGQSVRLISDSVNRGLIYRLNQMVELTDALYIARMDADDLMHPDRLRLQMVAFRAYPQLDIVSTGMAIMTSDYRVVGVRCVDGQPTLSDYMKYGGLVHASCIFRRKFLERNRYDPGYFRAEDRGLFLGGLPDAHYFCVTEPLYFCAEYNRFNKKKYLDSYRSERKVILQHGPRLLGWPATAAYFLRSAMKGPVVCLMVALGIAQRITRRASGPYYGNELSALQAIVDTILSMSRNRSTAKAR